MSRRIRQPHTTWQNKDDEGAEDASDNSKHVLHLGNENSKNRGGHDDD